MKISAKGLKESVLKNVKVLTLTFDDSHIETLQRIIACVVSALKKKKKILLCGNGGSAADSQHVAAELIGRFKKERRSLPAIALSTDTSIITAVANDYSFEEIFSRQVEGLGSRGDILIGISTSGNSANVIQAVQAARAHGMKTVSFTGKGGGRLGKIVDINFSIESEHTPNIQIGHIVALHAMCEAVENILYKS